MEDIVERHIGRAISEDFEDIEAVFLNGGRQTGKSTFAEAFGKRYDKVFYANFDDITLRAAETAAPGSTFDGIQEGLVILDEIQHIPNSFLSLKAKIDDIRRKKQNVRFLLTGSADIMLLPKLSEALVGRMYVRSMYPFSMAEILGKRGNFITALRGGEGLDEGRQFQNLPLSALISRATFPRLSLGVKKRDQWCINYISTMLERDIKNFSEIDRLDLMPPLLSILANRAGGLLNDADLAMAIKVSQPTVKRYRTLLNGVFLTFLLLPWFKKLEKRFVKSPKIYFTDTMLLCHILGFSPKEIEAKRPDLSGFILENFVLTELVKQLSLSDDGRLYHLRTSDQKEIDFLVEWRNGSLAALEVKAASSVTAADFRHIRFLADSLPGDFVRGIVLYRGDRIVRFGDRLYAVPLPALWEI